MDEEDERPTEAIAAAHEPVDEPIDPPVAAAFDPNVTPGDDPGETRLDPGTEVGGYIIDDVIGRGGMGVVYSATHPVIGKRAAVKVLRPEVSRSRIVVERFIQEARAVNQIGHPNIIDIFAFGALSDGRAYHVMDLLIGHSLRQRLRRGALHPSEAASVIDEVASALMAAHDKDFVHRDLKPDNVYLVAREGRWPEVKLLDFGLAKLMPEGGIAPFQTKAGVMLGTPEYMSPEQARGTGVDHRTDIYALGVVMFEILTGVRPFARMTDPFATLMQHAEEPPPALGSIAPELPVEMCQLVDAMLAKTPEARPSLAAVRAVIKRLRSTQLPTHTAAGLEVSLASVKLPPRAASAGPSLGITASRVGASPLVAVDPPASPRRSSQPALAPSPSAPPVAFEADDLRAPTSLAPYPSRPSPYPVQASHGGSRAASSPGVQRQLSVPPGGVVLPSTHGGRTTGPSSALLPRESQPIHAHTTLGIAPGVGAEPAHALPSSPRRASRGWLVFGALVAIAVGIVLAVVLVGS